MNNVLIIVLSILCTLAIVLEPETTQIMATQIHVDY